MVYGRFGFILIYVLVYSGICYKGVQQITGLSG